MLRVCVYCGSSPGAHPIFVDTAYTFGSFLADHGVGLIYGGGKVGCMGALADGALQNDGEVIGVIPESLHDLEVGHHGLTELHIVDNMHDRKAKMAGLADGFITLPGGLGTMEEMFEAWTWSQLKFHEKPIGLLNVGGYFDGLLSFLDLAVKQEFLKAPHRDLMIVDQDMESLLSRLASFTPSDESKWFNEDAI